MSGDGSGISKDMDGLSINEAPKNPFAAYDPEPPPAPKLHTKGVIAMDITSQFIAAASQLEVGQLVQDPFFQLFDAVGALEIMDKKMDSGYLEPGETMDDDYDFTQNLLPEEIIGIIDQLLCHEMAWHMGYPLAQTIFTSLHIDRMLSPCPLNLDQTIFDRSESCSDEEPLTARVLRAYCLGLIKTCFYVNTRVRAEHYYEEEDFVTHTFNRNLLDEFETDLILDFISSTIVKLDKTQEMAENFKRALDIRLDFRLRFLKAVEVADSRTATNVKHLWTEVSSILPELKSTFNLGKFVESAFSVKLQRKLASTVPPRPIVEVSQDTTFVHLERLCQDAKIAVEVLEYFDSQSLTTFVMLFQARKPQPSVYVRTLLQHYIFSDMIILGSMSIRQVLDDDLSTAVLPADKLLDRDNDEIEVPHDPRFNMASRMELFRSRAANSYLDILRTFCQNRCRIRRTLCHNISDWDNLQLDAEEIDLELRQFTKEVPIIDKDISDDPIYSFPLSSWAYFYKLRQMEWVVQMGFELETYQPDELAGMYWYLQYLAKTRGRHLERMRGFVVRSYGSTKWGRVSFSAEKEAEFNNALAFLSYSNIECAATYAFADALSCLFIVLARLGLIQPPPRPYSDDYLRYEVRMKPFSAIGLPELIPFEEFTKLVTQPEESTLDLLKFAAESVASSKKGFEIISKLSPKTAFCQGSDASWLKNVKDCTRACIFTSITISTVKKAVETAGKKGEVKLKMELSPAGKGYHDWWTVPESCCYLIRDAILGQFVAAEFKFLVANQPFSTNERRTRSRADS